MMGVLDGRLRGLIPSEEEFLGMAVQEQQQLLKEIHIVQINLL